MLQTITIPRVPVNSIQRTNAEAVKVNLVNYSWGSFVFNESGELFLNSEWGFFAASWPARSFHNFKRFLVSLSREKIVQAFEVSYRKVSGKSISSQCREALEVLSEEFLQTLKNESQCPSTLK